VTGVMINRKTGGDCFQPLSFELRNQYLSLNQLPPADLFKEAFGPKPDLVPVLGSEDAAKRVLERSKSGENKASLSSLG
jgi:hypothetical protein